jgi:hypothetical protein
MSIKFNGTLMIEQILMLNWQTYFARAIFLVSTIVAKMRKKFSIQRQKIHFRV